MYDFFYRRPRLLMLTISLIVVAGFSSYRVLPRMEDPILTGRVATLNAVFPGADAERVEALVTEPMEDALREIEEILLIRSSSRSGVSLVTVELRDEITDVDEVWSRVRDRAADAAQSFPSGAQPPEFREIDVKAYAMLVAVRWDAASPPQYAILRRHAETLKDRLLSVTGTEKVRLFGDPQEEFVATVDLKKLAVLGLSTEEVAAAIGASDAKVSAGLVRGTRSDFLIDVGNELDSLDRIGKTPIQIAGQGDAVRLEEIANVRKGIVDPPNSLAMIDGKPAVTLGVLVRDNERVDRWSHRVQDVLTQYRELLPAGVQLDTLFEQNRYVAQRMSTLLFNLVMGAAGVVLVVWLLMGWRNALIVAAALPLSALMVLSGMRAWGIPIHQMSITGLIIALGLLIDNAIVMVDEVTGEMRKGTAPQQAIVKTVRHLIIPLLGSTITTALAFAPIALMEGPAGEFVGSIAISVIMAIFSSLLVSMTIVPALTAWGAARPGAGQHWWQAGLELPGLSKPIRAGTGLGPTTTLVGCGDRRHSAADRFRRGHATAGTVFSARGPGPVSVGTGIAGPGVDDGNPCRDAPHARADLAASERVTRGLVPWRDAPSFYYNLVPRRENTSNYAQGLVQLASLRDARETIRSLQVELDRFFPQGRVLVRQLEQGPPFDAPVEIRVIGPDLATLRTLGEDVRSRLVHIADVVHTRSDLSESTRTFAVDVDEEQARMVGLNHADIAGQLRTSLEGITRGSVLEATEELPVRVRWTSARRGDLSAIASLDLLSPPISTGRETIPLSALASIRLTPESATIPHRNGERINEIQAYITAGVLPATVLKTLQADLAAEPLALPPGYRLQVGGEAAERDDAIGGLLANVGILAVLMVATLVMSFGSFRLSGVIGAVAALSMGLGLGALWLFGYPFGFMAIIGSMGLMGVAINDAIVVLAGIQAEPTARDGDRVAIRQVVLQTTRHVVATSLTTMVGFAPLIFGGGEFWPPLAVAIAGGVAGATLLAIYFVPSAYVLLVR